MQTRDKYDITEYSRSNIYYFEQECRDGLYFILDE